MKTKHSNHGVSIVELLIALAILSVGIYGVADVLVSSRKIGALAERRLSMSGLAKLKMEELCSQPEAVAAAVAPGTAEQVVPAAGPEVFTQDPRYMWQAKLTRDAATSAVIVQIDVSRKTGDTTSTVGAIETAKGVILLRAAANGGASS